MHEVFVECKKILDEGYPRRAIAVLYDFIDKHLHSKELREYCDTLFIDLNPSELGRQLSIALLFITFQFREFLPNRSAFLERAKDCFSASDDRAFF